ncbi:hypothetical protein EWM64_g1229 [Hericium alpestre]|uniref:alcohol dehydrogenase n=1 Tax=Hericium alpestre TaxID=135208 RepID=A0A4Z0A924_9AGAM|nr:hypothetical protein EWM64_g1229 [Hericium alpestre]
MAQIEIPRTQKAAVLVNPGKGLEVISNHPVTQPSELKPGQCLVKMHCTGVCHTDVHIAAGEVPHGPVPLVGGHEGIGTIVALGPAEGGVVKVGTRVGVRWLCYACGKCELCRRGKEAACESRKLAGHLVDGTFCQYMVAWSDHVVPIPDNVSDEQAVPVLCAGLTVYAALKACNAVPGDWVVIPGAGGGLGHLAIQYAHALGLKVVAVDTGDDKKDICLDLGAEKWIDFKQTDDIVRDIVATCDGKGAHTALIVTASPRAYEDSVKYLRTAGSIAVIGIPGPFVWSIPVALILRKSLHIIGHLLGTYQETVEALELVAQKKVVGHVNHRKLEDINDVFKDITQANVVGRTVIRLQ